MNINFLRALLPLLFVALPAAAETVHVNYSQLMVDYAVFRNPGVVAASIHAAKPGTSELTVTGATQGQTGAKSDAAVLNVMSSNKATIAASAGGARRSVLIPLRTAPGATIGVLALEFAHADGKADELYMDRAVDIRNRLQQITPEIKTLFDPYTKGYSPTDNLAQKINQILLERHPDVNVVAIHITKQGDKANKLWGINRPNFLDRVSDEIDHDTEKTGRIVMQVIPRTHRMEVHMPMLSKDGELWGTLCTVYFWHDLREAAEMYGRSLAIMDEARLLMPADRNDLFKP